MNHEPIRNKENTLKFSIYGIYFKLEHACYKESPETKDIAFSNSICWEATSRSNTKQEK